jgi:hypothetical protein
MVAYVLQHDPGRSIWGDAHVWAGDVICPGCEHMFSVYRHELDQEQHVIDDKLRFAKEALRGQCRAHIASFRIP